MGNTPKKYNIANCKKHKYALGMANNQKVLYYEITVCYTLYLGCRKLLIDMLFFIE